MKETLHSLHAREILDSRGTPTVEVVAQLATGDTVTASVPSGASTGTFEAVELRDGDAARYNGKGVQKACAHVNEILAPAVRGLDVHDQRRIDARLCELDGTPNKAKLGANAMLAVSLAAARASSVLRRMPLYASLRQTFGVTGAPTLPTPMMNIFNGGRHADDGLDFQEYMIVPAGATFSERLRKATETAASLGRILHEQGLPTSVGDEGGFAVRLHDNTAPLELLARAVEAANLALHRDMRFALDVASSEFFDAKQGRYVLSLEGKQLRPEQLRARYAELLERFPICSIEDGMNEESWDDWAVMTKELGGKVMLVGDDLFVTNVERIRRGIEMNAANAVLIKPNQIGTLTETMDAIDVTKTNGWTVVVSHRSGETNDTFLADLAVAAGATFIKAGSVYRGERVAKYNRLLAIEEELRR